jgi:hypothetical protein
LHEIVAVAVLGCFLVGLAAAQDEPLVVALWPGKAPEEPGTIGPERVRMSPKLTRKEVEVTESTRLITNVTRPTITIQRPRADRGDKDTGAAAIICPGGGYWDLYWQLEGEEVAHWLNTLGVTGVILKYRVPRRPDDVKGKPARRPLQDAQRAVRAGSCRRPCARHQATWRHAPPHLRWPAPRRQVRVERCSWIQFSARWSAAVLTPLSFFSFFLPFSPGWAAPSLSTPQSKKQKKESGVKSAALQRAALHRTASRIGV